MFLVTRPSALLQGKQILRQNRSVLRGQQTAILRLLSSLAILEQRNGTLHNSSLGAVSAALKLGGSISAFLAGSGAKKAAQEVARVKGVDKVIVVDAQAYDKVNIQIYLYLALR